MKIKKYAMMLAIGSFFLLGACAGGKTVNRSWERPPFRTNEQVQPLKRPGLLEKLVKRDQEWHKAEAEKRRRIYEQIMASQTPAADTEKATEEQAAAEAEEGQTAGRAQSRSLEKPQGGLDKQVAQNADDIRQLRRAVHYRAKAAYLAEYCPQAVEAYEIRFPVGASKFPNPEKTIKKTLEKIKSKGQKIEYVLAFSSQYSKSEQARKKDLALSQKRADFTAEILKKAGFEMPKEKIIGKGQAYQFGTRPDNQFVWIVVR